MTKSALSNKPGQNMVTVRLFQQHHLPRLDELACLESLVVVTPYIRCMQKLLFNCITDSLIVNLIC